MKSVASSKKKLIGLDYILDNVSVVSPLGSQKLKDLSFFGKDEDSLNAELGNIKSIVDNYSLVNKQLAGIRHLLADVKNITKSVAKLSHTVLDEVELFEVKKFLLTSNTILPLLTTLIKQLHLQKVCFADTTEALDIIDFDKQRIATFYFPNNYTQQLCAIRQQKSQLESAMSNADKRQQLTQQHLDLTVLERQEEAHCRKTLCQQLAPYTEQILTNLDCIGYIDLLIAKSIFSNATHAVRPTIGTKHMVAKSLINPSISVHLQEKGKTFTPISIELSEGVTVVTGANMGGKSVALQTIMLNCMLANLGFFVYADSMQCPIFDFFEFVNNEGESNKHGLSAFGSEIIKLNQVVERAQEKCGLIVFDEFAKTTNAGEGATLFSAVVKAFNQFDSITIMSTHFEQVSALAKAHYQVKGLSALPQINVQTGEDFISTYIDYGLIKVDGNQPIPKDALTICRLLNLSPTILEQLE